MHQALRLTQLALPHIPDFGHDGHPIRFESFLPGGGGGGVIHFFLNCAPFITD